MSSQPSPSNLLVPPEEYLEREYRAEYRSEYSTGEIVAMAGTEQNHNRVERFTEQVAGGWWK